MWNQGTEIPYTRSAPNSPAKHSEASRSRSESFHAIHKVPLGDTPYVRAKNVQLIDKEPEKAIPLFWAAINAGDRVDSALKDMAIVMKQQNRADEAIEAIKSLRNRCSAHAQESLDNILLDLYKRCGRLDEQIVLLKHKLHLIQHGLAFNGKRTKTARSQGRKFQVSVEQEATRLLGNLGWALMQQNNYVEAEDVYRRALCVATDNNKMCNLGICLMKQGRISEAKETLRLVKPAVLDGPRGMDSHLKAYDRAQQMLKDLESEKMMEGGNCAEHSKLFDAFLGSSFIWQPQPCRDQIYSKSKYGDENVDSNIIRADHRLACAPPPPPKQSFRQIFPSENSLNVDAPPFYYSKMADEQVGSQFLKRSRSENAAGSMSFRELSELNISLRSDPGSETKLRRLSDESDEKLLKLLPDNEEFERAILSAVLGSPDDQEREKVAAMEASVLFPSKVVAVEKRLKVFQDITHSLAPRV